MAKKRDPLFENWVRQIHFNISENTKAIKFLESMISNYRERIKLFKRETKMMQNNLKREIKSRKRNG